MKLVLKILLSLVLIGLATLGIESWRFKQWYERGQDEIKATPAPTQFVAIESLPQALQNYLLKVNPQKKTGGYVYLTQEGVFRLKPEDKM